MVVVGRLIDKLGTRLGYALAMVFWSLASMGRAGSSSRALLSRESHWVRGSCHLPASIKAVQNVPKKERALPPEF